MGTDVNELETGGRLTVDLSAVQSNFRLLQTRCAPAECAAVVKADAYGLGAGPVAAALHEAGARTFFVAHPVEARAVRTSAPDAVIYVLSGLAPGAAPALAEIGARPVLGSVAEIEEWAAFAKARNLPGHAAIHIDTGMNRLGLTMEECTHIADRFASGSLGFELALVMSHLACADELSHPLNARQLAAFRQAAAQFPGIPASLANSAATLQGSDFRFDLCRPGIALYGGNPVPSEPNPLRPVVRVEARIVQIREAAKGETVGYGAAQTLAGPARLAILSIGYADGLIRAGGSSDSRRGADVLIAGERCPLVGRVSMDLAAADISHLDPARVARGDFATVLGDGLPVDELAKAAGTIGYEILTRISPRFARSYRG